MTKAERLKLARKIRRDLSLYINSFQPFMVEHIASLHNLSPEAYRAMKLAGAQESLEVLRNAEGGSE